MLPSGRWAKRPVGRAQLSRGEQLCLPALAPSHLSGCCLLRSPKARCRCSGPSTGMLTLPPLLGAGTRRDHHATQGTSHTPSLSLTSIPQTSGWNPESLRNPAGKRDPGPDCGDICLQFKALSRVRGKQFQCNRPPRDCHIVPRPRSQAAG